MNPLTSMTMEKLCIFKRFSTLVIQATLHGGWLNSWGAINARHQRVVDNHPVSLILVTLQWKHYQETVPFLTPEPRDVRCTLIFLVENNSRLLLLIARRPVGSPHTGTMKRISVFYYVSITMF